MKILAAVFALAILVKIIFLLLAPERWLRLADAWMANRRLLTQIYAVAAVIVGLVVFTHLGIIEVAAVMLLTSLLFGLALLPYADAFDKIREEVLRVGVRGAWLPLLLWGVLAVAVLIALWRAA